MTPRTPVDEAIRREIRDAHRTTMFVEAGAGTGKTTALVGRVVAMVSAGHAAMRDVAAITFTEAAAAELRDRVRSSLERASVDVALDDVARRRCVAALEELDDAALTTLHGFAQRLLDEHPLEAGLPPRFDVVDDVEASVVFERRWADFADELSRDPAMEHTLLRMYALGLDLADFRRLAVALRDHTDRIDSISPAPAWQPKVDVTPVVRHLEAALAHGEACTQPDDTLVRHLEALRPLARAIREGDALDQLDLLGTVSLGAGSRMGNKNNWRCPVGEVRALLEEAESARAQLLGRCRLALVEAVVARIGRFLADGLEARRRAGRIEFHDLLVLARDVLRGRPDVRAALSQRFRVLLVDELQDTDPLQIEIAVLLATRDHAVAERPWNLLGVDPGGLFLVGDPEQAIYRFRRADLALYRRAEEVFHAGARELVENFRSVPGLLEWVNQVFGRLFAAAQPSNQARHRDLAAHREPLDGPGPPVATFGGALDASITDIREREAVDVAALVTRIKAEGWRVVDPHTGEPRAAHYGDIALLLPTRTALGAIEAALERADVPLRIESQSLVFSTPEARDLLAMLAAIDDPSDEVALVTSLRAPAFACGDDDLLAYRLAGGRFCYLDPPPGSLPADHPVNAALDTFRELHRQRPWRTVADTLDALVRERRVVELVVVHRRPRDHWRRIGFLLDQARSYDEAGNGGLRGFVEWARRQSDERARALESVAPEPDDDAVRILTVHGAKGLEFPIVVLAGLNAVRVVHHPPVLWRPDGIEVRVGSLARRNLAVTPGYDDCSAAESEFDAAERLRLLYVAATRARDHLVLSLHHKARSSCHAATLAPCVAASSAVELVLDCSERPVRPRRRGAGVEAAAGSREAWIARRRRLLERAARPATVAATALTAETADGVTRREHAPDDDPAPWRRGRAGTAMGRAVHATLQSIDLGTSAGVDDTAHAQALAEGLSGREREVGALVRSVLEAPVVRETVERRRYWREVPVAAPFGEVVLEGFVDLLVQTPAGLVIVDYKTDSARGDDDLDASLVRHEPQGAAYALALGAALRRPVARCVFVFARADGPAVEREIVDLGRAVARVRVAVGALTPDVRR